MNELRLVLREEPPYPLDLSPLSGLWSLRPAEIRRLSLDCGGTTPALSELFDVAGSARSGRLRIEGGSPRFLRLGAGLETGTIEVHGAAGEQAGRGLHGGRLVVHGDAGDWCGAGMRGGHLLVHGRVGSCAGAAWPGEPTGMNEGILHARGDAGARCGEAMRRGLLLVEGDAGDCCAARMRAGTIVVMGRLGRCAGPGMRRGSLILMRSPRALPATFRSGGCMPLGILKLLFRQVAMLHGDLKFFSKLPILVERHTGDLSNGGKGEVLTLQVR